MSHLFAYGTLMCGDIMADVAGVHLRGEPASLRGYRRRRVAGEHYPALVPDADGGCVEGVIYRDVPPAAWARLDRFEGAMYAREPVRVTLADGTWIEAGTYVARDTFVSCVTEHEWDFPAFLREGKEIFRRSYGGFDALA